MFDVTEIEQQHRKLIDILDILNGAVENHVPRQDIYRIIDDVISYTELHFASEEQIMIHYGFPETEAHKNHHKVLIKDALRLKGKLDYVGEDMFREWFNHWFYTNVLAHIKYADQQIEDYISQSGARE